MLSPRVISLECLRCRRTVSPAPDAYLCPTCGDGGWGDPGILDVGYDYTAARPLFQRERSGPRGRGDLFRFTSLLPVASESSALLAGGTPLIEAPRLAQRLGLRALYIKDETRNPSRCLKDRASAVGVALAAAAGRSVLYCASAGNAAISLAAFCAHQGLECHVFVPADVSQVRLDWLRRYGAQVTVADGDYDRAFELSELAGRSHQWFSRNCAFNPFLVEGKKTVSFEIAEALGWQAPDLVIAPVGDGCTLGAIGKGSSSSVPWAFSSGFPASSACSQRRSSLWFVAGVVSRCGWSGARPVPLQLRCGVPAMRCGCWLSWSRARGRWSPSPMPRPRWRRSDCRGRRAW